MARGRPMNQIFRTGPMRQHGERKYALADGAKDLVREALTARKKGDHAGASAAFAELAKRNSNKGLHLVAIRLQVLAGVELADDAAAALEAGRLAITYGAEANDKRAAGRLFHPLLDKLDTESRVVLEREVVSGLGLERVPAPHERPTLNRSLRRQLPKRCGSCGAPVRDETLDFNVDGALCGICGQSL